ncbi:MAG: hypothetical protein QM527_07135 [Alphaproteobacteria bacterium]|nr:hypothetical protein [Alphaproteobacteria bacterium]
MKKALLALALASVVATATAQNADSTVLQNNAGMAVKNVRLFRVLAGQSITVYSFKQCLNQYAPPQGLGGYWILNNTTQTDMNFVCEGW